MAPIPTIQRPMGGASGSANRPGASKRPRHGEQDKKSELVCRVRYCNNLPDLPFDPKFIQHPFESNRFIQYAPTSLERNYKYELLTEQDLGVSVDLILPETYEKTEQQTYNEYDQIEMDPKDERLLEEEVSDKTDKKRSYQHSLMLSWMRKPDYISTEQTRYQPITNDMIESKIGFNVRKKMGAESNLMMDRDTQLAAIEKTFEDAKVPIEEHYSKKGVVPVEISEVLPDDKMWKYQWAQVIFDTDPAPTTEASGAAAQNEMMSQAMIRGVMDESGEQFVAYFLPTKDTMEKRADDFAQERDYDEEGEYNYKMFREYNWNVKSKATEGFVENFFFISREDGVFYNELETRVRLSKRRLKAGQQPSNSKLIVRHRPLVRKEQRDQRKRERLIEPPNDEDEEEESSSEEEPEEEPIKDTKGDEDEGRRSRSRSKSRSRSRSKSRSRSASSRSRSRSVSRSRSRSVSRSRSRSASKSPARSAKSAGSMRSRSGSRSKSRSRSVSRSRSRSRSKSRSRSRSKSGSRSRSGSPAARSAGSRSRSRSRSKSRSRSRSKSRSRSRSRSASGSRSPGSRSRSGSPMSARSGSGSD